MQFGHAKYRPVEDIQRDWYAPHLEIPGKTKACSARKVFFEFCNDVAEERKPASEAAAFWGCAESDENVPVGNAHHPLSTVVFTVWVEFFRGNYEGTIDVSDDAIIDALVQGKLPEVFCNYVKKVGPVSVSLASLIRSEKLNKIMWRIPRLVSLSFKDLLVSISKMDSKQQSLVAQNLIGKTQISDLEKILYDIENRERTPMRVRSFASEPHSDLKRVCETCQTESWPANELGRILRCCSGCQRVFYCSLTCQRLFGNKKEKAF